LEDLKKHKIFFKYLKRILLFFLILFSLIIGAAFVIGNFYEDKVKDFLVSEIDKLIVSEVQVEKIELTLIRKFPYASLRFKNVVMKDAIDKGIKGNLLKAKNIYFKFSIFDLFKDTYSIKKIEINDADLKLLVYENGSDNFHILKPEPDSLNKSFSFDLQKIYLENSKINYTNFASEQEYQFVARNAYSKGKFSKEKYSLAVYGKFFIDYIKSENYTILHKKNADVDLILSVDNIQNNYKIQKGSLSIDKLNFDVNGAISKKDNLTYLDLLIKGVDLDLHNFIKELPEKEQQYFEDYKTDGNFYFSTNIQGNFGGSKIPKIKANFGINNGNFLKRNSSTAIENLVFTAEYSNGKLQKNKSSYIRINNISGKLKSGNISGNLLINNFENPEIELTAKADIDLSDFLLFFEIDTITSLTGKIILNGAFKTKLHKGKGFTVKDFIDSKTSGKIILTDANFKIKDDPNNYKNFNGSFAFSNNDIIVKKLSGEISNSDFIMKGYFRNMLSFIFLPDENLQIDAKIVAKNIDLNELLQVSNKSDTIYKLEFSENLDLKLNFNIEKLNFRRFDATKVAGKLRLKNKKMFVHKISFSSMDGNTTAQGIIDGSQKDKLIISCDGKISDVDVEKFFYQFENFGQDNITDKHLKGVFCADIQFSGTWSSSLICDLNSIASEADIIIKNGELNNYTPMYELSKFLKVDDLSKILFSTLKNKILIKNKMVIIPKMEIESNVINILGSGTHSFDNKINYHLQILMSELLANKAKMAKKENKEFSIIEDDGLGKTKIFILITGTAYEPIFKYDRKEVAKKIVTDLVKEKLNLKKILNEEFGLFKSDTSFVQKKKSGKAIKKEKEKQQIKTQEEGKFIIEWDEDDDDDDKKEEL